ncbi:MAG: beta-ketoacyl-ACP synthase III [Calothrix sp. MO_192.B10]|nr:beta-ketoacyl-ACP synthase III [Calothrix sp. MO_192.B10]
MERRKVKILSTGKYLPKQRVTAKELGSRLGIPESWIEKKSGVMVRHFVEDETASYMGAIAAQNALELGGLCLGDIDCIIATSAVPEQGIPCTAALIQKQLGGGDSGIPAFDINSSCLSFIVGLDMASYLICANRYQRILLVASEIATNGLNWEDKESCTLFGDGAAAVIVTPTGLNENSHILTANMETYSKGAHLTECRGAGNKYHPQEYGENPQYFQFRMDGRAVYRLSAAVLPDFMQRLLKSCELHLTDIKMVIPHQASLMAMRLMSKQLHLPPEKVMVIAHNHGNTIAASVPMALHEAIVQGKISRGDRILLLGTSAGFSVGGIVLEY